MKKSTQNLLIKMGVFLVSVIILFGVVFNVQIAHSNIMYPSIKDGDLIISFKLDKFFNNDDVVLYTTTTEDGKTINQFGRIVAQEGDDINISSQGVLNINGMLPAEEVFYPTVLPNDAESNMETDVDEDSVYILNDFRTNTADSRVYGSIPKSDIKAKVVFIVRRRGI